MYLTTRTSCSRHAGSILLRGANEYTLDEMERALHDSMCCVKRVLESNDVVPGKSEVYLLYEY